MLITALPVFQALALIVALGQDLSTARGIAIATLLTAAAATLAAMALVLAKHTSFHESTRRQGFVADASVAERSEGASTTSRLAAPSAGSASQHTTAPIVDILALKAANDEAGRANESEAWAALLHQIHHELRTPLNAVIGFTDLMQREPYGPLGSPRYREYLAHIQQSGALLLKSAEDTLAMTNALAARRAPAAARDKIAIQSLAQSAWEQLPLEPAEIGFHLVVESADAHIEGDAIALRQVFSNLFCEAIARSDVSGAIQLAARVDQDFVRVEVRSHGRLTSGNVVAPTLDICIARTLLELHGAGLIVVARPGEPWRAVTVLDHAAQTDFFAQCETTTGNPRPGLRAMTG